MGVKLCCMEFKYPEYDGNSIYNLACLLSESLGTKTNGKPLDLNLEKDRTILILIDGFGINYIKKLNIKNYKTITTVFPSTTATVMTTLFTAKTPGEHGVIGYTNYSNDLGIINAMRYTFNGLDINESLTTLKDFNEEFNVDSYLKRTEKSVVSILPGRMDKSTFTGAINGGKYLNYKSFWDSLYLLNRAVNLNYDFIYYYLPYVDSMAHSYGTYEKPALDAAEEIYSKISQEVEKFKDKYNIIITADHGHFPVSENVMMNDRKDLLNKLDVMPYGDSRALFLRTRYSIDDLLNFNDTEIFNKEKIIKSNMLGNIDDRFINRIGDYLIVPHDGKAFIYQSKIDDNYHLLKSHHGGLTMDEQLIPLFYI